MEDTLPCQIRINTVPTTTSMGFKIQHTTTAAFLLPYHPNPHPILITHPHPTSNKIHQQLPSNNPAITLTPIPIITRLTPFPAQLFTANLLQPHLPYYHNPHQTPLCHQC